MTHNCKGTVSSTKKISGVLLVRALAAEMHAQLVTEVIMEVQAQVVGALHSKRSGRHHEG